MQSDADVGHGNLADHPAVVAALPSTRFVTVAHAEKVDSTQDWARQRALATGHEVAVVADHQRRGRGRRGRMWIDDRTTASGSPTNLALSVAVAAHGPVALMPLATGLAVKDVAGSIAGDGVALKWPNDVMIAEKKLAGILAEHHHDGQELVGRWSLREPGADVGSPYPDRPSQSAVASSQTGFVVIGMGLNVDWAGVSRDGLELTSLAEACGHDLDRGEVLAAVLSALDRRLAQLNDDARGLLEDYRQACATIGRHVRVILPAPTVVEGVARRVDNEGRLVVVTADARDVAVAAGDVEHVR